MGLSKEREMKIERAGLVCFYIGLLIEILILILDKCSWTNPVEGQMFRVSFLFFALKVCTTKYSFREWCAIAAAGAVAAVCYLVSTRDEAVRMVVFVIAMKGVDHRRALKTVFWCTVAGMIVLAGLAFAGVLGEVVDTSVGYGFKEGTFRLCLGVGNPNALAIMIWALMTLGIYLYYERLKVWHYGLLFVLTVLVYLVTVTRTALLTMLATLAGAVMLRYIKKLQTAAWVYLSGIMLLFAEIGFSIYAAYVSDWYDYLSDFALKADRILTGRIVSINGFDNGGGILENWRLFGDPDYVEYIDMGYVRLFFWYGIIPGAFCILFTCLLLWQCRKQRDYMGFVMTMSFVVSTLAEAHAVSVYIARNYVLFLMGAYWIRIIDKRADGCRGAYWWRFWELFQPVSDGKEA